MCGQLRGISCTGSWQTQDLLTNELWCREWTFDTSNKMFEKPLGSRCRVLTNSSNISKTSQGLTAVEAATQYVSCTVGWLKALACVSQTFCWFCLGHHNFKCKCKSDLSCLISFSFQICIFSFHFGSPCTKRGRTCGFRSDERGLFSTKVKFGIFGSLNTEHVS